MNSKYMQPCPVAEMGEVRSLSEFTKEDFFVLSRSMKKYYAMMI
jgi:hypothetical protein